MAASLPLRGALCWVASAAALACAVETPAPLPDLVVDVSELRLMGTDVVFADVRDAAITPEGIWILDGAEPFVTGIAPDGTVRARFGRAGRGPSELLRPRAIQSAAPTRSSDLLVWDPGNGRVTRFGITGHPVEVTQEHAGHAGIRSDLPHVTYVDPFRIRRIGSHFAYERYPAGLSRTADLTLGRVMVADAPSLRGGSAITATPLDGPGQPATPPGELGGMRLWDGCGDLGLAVWSPVERAVTWLTPDGTATGSAAIPIPPRRLTDSDIEGYLRLMARLETGAEPEAHGVDLSAMVRSARTLFAREAPVVTEVRCGPDHETWLRLFDTTSDPLGRGRDWLVVGMPGLTRVRLPESFSPLLILPDRVVGVLERDEGQRLAWWSRASLPGTSPTPTLE